MSPSHRDFPVRGSANGSVPRPSFGAVSKRLGKPSAYRHGQSASRSRVPVGPGCQSARGASRPGVPAGPGCQPVPGASRPGVPVGPGCQSARGAGRPWSAGTHGGCSTAAARFARFLRAALTRVGGTVSGHSARGDDGAIDRAAPGHSRHRPDGWRHRYVPSLAPGTAGTGRPGVLLASSAADPEYCWPQLRLVRNARWPQGSADQNSSEPEMPWFVQLPVRHPGLGSSRIPRSKKIADGYPPKLVG
jgi:hypothetical protein